MYHVEQTLVFSKWLKKLRNLTTKMKITQRIARFRNGHFGDHKSVGDKVYELRIDAYRVYYVVQGQAIVILLAGGHKDTQQKDIRKAKALLQRLEK